MFTENGVYSYYEFLMKLCNGVYPQAELNEFIERLFKIGESYIRYSFHRVKKVVDSHNHAYEDIAIEAIAPLFQNANYNNHYVIVDKIRNWQPAIRSESESLFFLNKVISNRIEQQISLKLRQSDPIFSKLLDSVNYLIRTGNYNKINYLGKIYIIESCNTTINWVVISDDEFLKIPAYLLFEKKVLLKSLFNFMINETPYFPAIPLNELVYRLKHINLSGYVHKNSVDDISVNIEIKEIVNSGLSFVKDKLKTSYYEKGKINYKEYETLSDALCILAADLGNGGVNSNLYNYLLPHFDGLTKEDYQKKFHNILEYLVKVLKNKVAKEFNI